MNSVIKMIKQSINKITLPYESIHNKMHAFNWVIEINNKENS